MDRKRTRAALTLGTASATLGTALALIAVALPAQRLPFSVYSVDDGLPATQIWSVVEDRRGFLWVATSWGLARFDGSSFSTLSVPEGLPSPIVRTVLEDPSGELWIGTSAGLARYDGHRLISYRGRPELDAEIWTAALDRHGQAWFGTESGLVVATRPGFRRYGRADGLPGDFIYSLLAASDGSLWLGTRGNGVARCLPGAGGELGECRSLGSAEGLGGTIVRALAEDRSGRILIGTRDRGLVIFENGRFTTFGRAEGLPSEDVYALLVRAEGSLVIGTDGGGLSLCLEGAPGRCLTLSEANGLPDDGVRALAEDREGGLWIGTEGGLARFQDESVRSYTVREGLPDDHVYSLEAEPDGSLWVGTVTGLGRLALGPHGEPLARVRTLAESDLEGRWIWALHRDRRGRVWVGTDDGVCRIAATGCVAVPLGRELPADHVVTIAEDHQGALWLGGRAGVTRLEEGPAGELEVRRFTSADGLLSDHVHDLEVDGAGRLWAAHAEGLSWWSEGRFRIVAADAGLPATSVSGLALARDGALLVGGYGFVARQLPGGAEPGFRSWFAAVGLEGVLVVSAAETESGRLLLGTNRGLLLFDPAAAGGRGAVLRRFDRSTGGVATEVSHGEAFARDATGRLWYGFKGGLTALPEAALASPETAPSVALVALESARGRVFRAPFTAVTTRPIGWLEGGAPELPADDGALRVSARAQTLAHRGDLRYQFRLEGRESEWPEARPEAFREFTNLEPGRYRVAVRAARAGGPWSAPARLDFVLRAGWWQTPGFRLLATLIAGAALLVGARLRLAALARRTRALERQVTERTDDLARYAQALAEHLQAVDRAAQRARRAEEGRRDLFARTSHELRTPLTAILGFSELLERALDGRLEAREQRYLANVRDGGEHLLRLVNNLLDQLKLESGRMEVHSEHVDLASLLQSVASLMEGFALHRGVRIEIRCEGELAPVEVDLAKLRQVLLNLLSNAVKFSPRGESVQLQARAIEAAASPLGLAAFELSVTDHGPGIPEAELEAIFEPYRQLPASSAAPTGTGLGLSIARQLVELMGGVLGVDSKPGLGAVFQVVLPSDPVAAQARREERIAAAALASGRARLLVIEADRPRFTALAERLGRDDLLAVRAATAEEAERMLGELRPVALVARLDPGASEAWRAVAPAVELACRARVPLSLLVTDDEGLGFALSLDAVVSAAEPDRVAAEALAAARARAAGGRRGMVLVAAGRDAGAALAAAIRHAGGEAFRVEGEREVLTAFDDSPADALVIDIDHLVRLAPEFGGGRSAPALAYGRPKLLLLGGGPQPIGLARLAARLRLDGGESGTVLAGSVLALLERAAVRRLQAPP